ncbi:hypothetical protein [Fulvimarina manganoxydans]|uniref:hypothetical protein n=1 Tax=Fulvimarina manganoxydans TaxID=937218 RepID=UPI00111BE2A3|nr:hypothetical protein [Fulvimarina manganoxydans]
MENIIARAIQSGRDADRAAREAGLVEELVARLTDFVERDEEMIRSYPDVKPSDRFARLVKEGRALLDRAALSAHAPASEDVASHEALIGDTQTGLPVTGESQDGWHPIETAPKDGTWIEAYRPPLAKGRWQTLVICRWYEWPDGDPDPGWYFPDEPEHDFTTAEGIRVAEHVMFGGDAGYNRSNHFTHWRHLPTPPSPAKREEG